jgi:hypothetical protein
VEQRDELELPGIEDLTDGRAHALVDLMCACVDQRGPLVVDQELVERDPVVRAPARDPVYAVDDFVDPGLRLVHDSAPRIVSAVPPPIID